MAGSSQSITIMRRALVLLAAMGVWWGIVWVTSPTVTGPGHDDRDGAILTDEACDRSGGIWDVHHGACHNDRRRPAALYWEGLREPFPLSEPPSN